MTLAERVAKIEELRGVIDAANRAVNEGIGRAMELHNLRVGEIMVDAGCKLDESIMYLDDKEWW